jgi:hypothetical protein
MMLRTLAALAALAGVAWAQTPEGDPSAPVTQAAIVATEPSVVAPAPTIPSDPAALADFARANARAPEQCRFAFTRLQTTAAHVGWSDADAEAALRFDPRLVIGERWTVVRATRQQRAMQRAMARQDRKGLPSDLIALTAEGEWTFENIAVAREQPDRVAFSYAPRMRPERVADEAGVGIIEQLVGEFEVSRETGRIISNTLREPPADAVRAMGIVRVHRALLRTAFLPGANGFHLSESGSQMFAMSALFTQTEVTTSFRITEVEAICDPAEVARIAAAEAAAAAAQRD